MEDKVCAFHDLIKGARLEEICFVEGQVSGKRCAQQLEVLHLLFRRQASYCATNIISLLKQLLHDLCSDVA